MTDLNKDALNHLHLGQQQAYVDQYDPTLLQTVPRSLARDGLTLPETFFGEDIWTAYELSWLNPEGMPEVAIAEMTFKADTSHIVESKSFKYYLNSYNQSTFGSLKAVSDQIKGDLQRVVESPVSVVLYELSEYQRLKSQGDALEALLVDDFHCQTVTYTPDANLLVPQTKSDPGEEVFVSHMLKSNCPVTGQPDWASVWVGVTGPSVTPESLLAYFISFRQHQDFHENCVERMFSDLLRVTLAEQLWVYARYTRRGGLDINPFRSMQPMDTPQLFGPRQ